MKKLKGCDSTTPVPSSNGSIPVDPLANSNSSVPIVPPATVPISVGQNQNTKSFNLNGETEKSLEHDLNADAVGWIATDLGGRYWNIVISKIDNNTVKFQSNIPWSGVITVYVISKVYRF